MNRPAVRNVRALRTERELDRARQVHAQGRERRRVAASHRGIVASVLLGVSLGAWVLGLVTALPWWPALLPSALLGASAYVFGGLASPMVGIGDLLTSTAVLFFAGSLCSNLCLPVLFHGSACRPSCR